MKKLLMLTSLALLVACDSGVSDDAPQIITETGFLETCDGDAGCEDGLSCVCGICTTVCTDDQICEQFGDVSCTGGTGPECAQTAVCAVVCNADSECQRFDDALRCDNGACVAPPADDPPTPTPATTPEPTPGPSAPPATTPAPTPDASPPPVVTPNPSGQPVLAICHGDAGLCTGQPQDLGCLDFGRVEIGTQATLSVSLQNTGNAPLDVTNLTVSDAVFTITGNAPMTLMPGELHRIEVTYMPTAPGATSGVLAVDSSDAAHPSINVCLNGEGVDGGAMPDGLQVQLTWDHDSTDLDIHLSPAEVAAFAAGDCYSMNCAAGSASRPDWCAMGPDEGDPQLDIDDNDGFGPENINVTTPCAGSYAVRAYYWLRQSPVPAPDTTATVTIFCNGRQQAQYTQAMNDYEDLWDVATVTFPGCVVEETGGITPDVSAGFFGR